MVKTKNKVKMHCINNNNHAFIYDNHNVHPSKGFFFFCSCFFLSFYCFLLLVQNLFNEKTRKKKRGGGFREGKGNKLNICKKNISKKIC